MTLRVWAPAARRVEVDVAGERRTLSPSGRGWHEGPAPTGDYTLVLDGGPPLPDPRSPWQPNGVHGASRPVDHSGFPWTDEDWTGVDLASAVIYELHAGTFSPAGTFDGAAERLDHVVDLGVDVIEIMPVAQFPGRWGWGYDGVDLYAPHHGYGGPDGLKRLVDACHRRGLAVVLDVVYNHLGPAGNYLGRFGPYFTDRYRTPWGEAVNLDGAGSDAVRAFIVDNACMWLRDYHIDGLRLDAVHALYDHSATHLLEELATAVGQLAERLGRRLVLIAESDRNDPRTVRPVGLGGFGIDAQWNDDFHHALHVALTGERDGYYADFEGLRPLATSLRRGFVFGGEYSHYRDRRHGRLDPNLSGRQLIGYLQNHDQVGNRAAGERASALMSTERLKVAAALVLTAPFVPLVFAGEEWGATTPFLYFTDHDDPELADAVRRGRREEFAAFGWRPEAVPDPQDPESYERSKLDWSEPERSPHAEVLRWYRDLIALRRATPELRDGAFAETRAAADEDGRRLVVDRGPVRVVADLRHDVVDITVDGAMRLSSRFG